MLTFKGWNFIKIDNVCSNDELYKYLATSGFECKQLTKAHIVCFNRDNFDEYLMSLSKNRRNKTNKQIRQLSKLGEVSFKVITSYDEYLAVFEEMRNIYVSRWGQDLAESIYRYRNEALKGLFPKGCVKLFILKVGDRIAGFHLGFVYKDYFYSWKEAAAADFASYSIGNMVRVYYIPQYLINNDILGINFMAGDYDYKSNRVGDSGRIDDISAFYSSKGLVGLAKKSYFLTYRDKLKSIRDKIYNIGKK